MSTSRHPEVLWAQRSEKVYLTIALPDAKNVSVKSDAQGLFSFSAMGAQGESFDFSLALYGTTDPEKCHASTLCGKEMWEYFTSLTQCLGIFFCLLYQERITAGEAAMLVCWFQKGCKVSVGSRNIICSIQKEQKGWWNRLLKSDEKPAPYIKVDWNKWCDEDEEESLNSDLSSEDDGAADNGEDESSDEEGMLYLPDLEKARGK